ncbi:MAG: tetratricopeptide repeat protein [Candidatus Marinimicrobia bacterium]|nr:tetratricopeptide repeat protein [Candidatus Neomarinimicrobiota bacterium]
MNRKTYFFIIIFVFFSIDCLYPQITVTDTDQDLAIERKIQNIQDSLETIFQHNLANKLDSLKAIYQEKQTQMLDKFQERSKVNYEYTKNLEDSLNILKEKLAQYQHRNSIRDSTFEKRYYEYIDRLLEYKDKNRTDFLGLSFGGREINEYKINILKQYLNKYSPFGKSAYVRYYLTQVYNNQKEYAKAEYSFLKFLYLYTDSPAYNELKHSLLEIVLEQNYYQDRTGSLVKIMDNMNQEENFEQRYFNFINKLKDYPHDDVQKHFIPEVDNFIIRFGDTQNSATLLYSLYEYYMDNKKVQYAFLTLRKITGLLPNYHEADLALFQQAKIQAQEFKEYNEALSAYNRFIEENPGSKLADEAYFRIATIFEEYLQKYDMAFNKYQEFANKYPHSEYVMQALNRMATIAEEKLNEREVAIDLYLQIAQEHANSKAGHKSRVQAANLYYKDKQYTKAIDQFLILYRQAPLEKESIDYVLRAADIYENKLKDIDKTIDTLTYITENFPGTKAAEKAKTRIEKLSQRNQD